LWRCAGPEHAVNFVAVLGIALRHVPSQLEQLIEPANERTKGLIARREGTAVTEAKVPEEWGYLERKLQGDRHVPSELEQLIEPASERTKGLVARREGTAVTEAKVSEEWGYLERKLRGERQIYKVTLSGRLLVPRGKHSEAAEELRGRPSGGWTVIAVLRM
jgi:hypothetical protein